MNKNSLNTLIKKSNLDNTDYYVYNKSRTLKEDNNINYTLVTIPEFNNYIVLYLEEIDSCSKDKEIIYISALKIINNNIDSKLESYINPKTQLPLHSLKKLELYSIDLKNSLSLEEFLPYFLDFVTNFPLIIYDINSITNFISKLNIKIENPILDTKYTTKYMFPDLKRYSLSYLKKSLSLKSNDKNKTNIIYSLYLFLQNNYNKIFK